MSHVDGIEEGELKAAETEGTTANKELEFCQEI
uniref:Uncharacterized protein n=1 Tax=Triticum urartu TaxID=4572 RepID=A0A8R7QSN5_TRIUA